MAIDLYIPASVTKVIVVIIILHVIVGLFSPTTLAFLLDRYLMTLQLMTDFLAELARALLRTVLGL